MRQSFSLVFALFLSAGPCLAQTGAFVDKWDDHDVRVVSYNIFSDSIFPDDGSGDPEIPDRFARFVSAVQPDVLALQEIYNHTAAETAALVGDILPVSGGWNAHRWSDSVILSRFPFSFATGDAGHADVLIDLPDNQYASDLYVLSDHLPCCSNEEGRQEEADEIIQWLDDVRSPGGAVTVPDQTPMVVLGDFNIVGSGAPLQTLLTGEVEIGIDSPPDWDGTAITDANPLHNGVGPQDYTWRNDSSSFAPGVLDYILYTDSVADPANRFVLNPSTMSAAELLATGLQANDVVVRVASGQFDHLPLIVDFDLPAPEVPGDYTGDGVVDLADYAQWATQFGLIGPGAAADGNGDGLVDSADYTLWRDNLGIGASSAVPEPNALLIAAIAALAVTPRRHRPA